jgi:hypothetical protein
MPITKENRQLALELFSRYFRENYPGPRTVINDPDWHAPKIFRAVERAFAEAADGCQWCLEGNTRVVSSIDPEGKTFVHHTSIGRVLCSKVSA